MIKTTENGAKSRDNKGIVILKLLKISHLSVIPSRIYGLPKLKK